MNNSIGPTDKMRDWITRHPDFERFIRTISPAFLYGALDERLSFQDALNKAFKKKLPSFSVNRTMCLGGLALFLFFGQVFSGVMLSLYYKPSPESAYASVQFIEQQVPLGFLIRQLHAWGGGLMVLFVFLHMIKVFFNKAYRPPREFTWVAGSFLLLITLLFAFTGFLLPWSEASYWSVRMGTSLLSNMPFIGDAQLQLIYGGKHISEITISRFFSIHCIILPWISTGFMLIHFIIIRRLGISEPQ